MNNGYDKKYSKLEGYLGQGLYSSKYSSKSASYATNKGLAEKSSFKAVIVNTVSLGKMYTSYKTRENATDAPEGYNSVRGMFNSKFGNDEYAVYNNDAVRPAYLVICDKLKVDTFPVKPEEVNQEFFRVVASRSHVQALSWFGLVISSASIIYDVANGKEIKDDDVNIIRDSLGMRRRINPEE
ncbi:hypothetical protein FRB94_009950 [Tulasnella sp. JGI-2019a]|nr:hypothetical protein FRB93_009141 [Tulasnella sp. JGI-2019a]KAG8994315.1 hypothetical protein FRB94_009950 [Tulasnella sp. JGI-2019a]